MLAKATPTDRKAARRANERKSRQRRAANVAHMKATLSALEIAVVVLPTLHDDDAAWDDFLDAKIMRVRHLFRQQLRLTNEAAALALEHAQLRRLLREHELATQAITNLLQNRSGDEPSIKRWREIARKRYTPWTLDACQDEMDAALRIVHEFQWSVDKQTSGLSFLGWRERRRVDPVRGAVQFQFSKTFAGYDIMDYVNVAWDTYTNATVYKDVILGPHARGDLDVLQQLSPNIIIVRVVERCSAIDVDAHAVYLVFRVRTERGFIQCVRTICCSELVREIDGPRDMWPLNFLWFQWERLKTNEQGYELRIGGSFGEIDVDYATLWMTAGFGCVLRTETLATGRKLVICD